MRTIFFALTTVALCLATSSVFAQAPTTVQLPTFRFFTVQTTVSVPDRGSASLGGVSRANSLSTWRGAPGLPASRGMAIGRDAGGISVHATIIDHAAIDRALLAEAARRRDTPAKSATAAKADFISRNVGRTKPRQ